MAEGIFYRMGRWAGKHPGPAVVLVFIVLGAIYEQAPKPSYTTAATGPASPPAQPAVEAPDPRIAACGPQLQERRADAKAAFAQKRFRDAFDLLDYCDGRMPPGSSEQKEYLQYATALGRVIDAEKAAELKAEKARKKKAGVSLGMTMQDALDSSWGRPEKVNRSTNAYGTREQWVYGGGNYLYFENGVLTSFSN